MSAEAPDALLESYTLLRQSVGLVDLPQTTVIELTGEDRIGWLQGQTTQDLRNFDPNTSRQTCLCSPTGQLQAIATIYNSANRLLIVTDQPEVILKRAEDLIIMEDVEYKVISAGITSYQGPLATKTLSQAVDFPAMDVLDQDDILILRSDRSGSGGWDIVTTDSLSLPEVPNVHQAGLDLATLEAGIPKFLVDTTPKTLPPELGETFEKQTINYRKGCYSGQEVLQRIKTRGHTNKTWIGLYLESPASSGDQVTFRDEVVGTIHRSGNSPDFGFIASATLKNKASNPGLLVQVNGINAEVVEMPFLRFD